MVKYWRTLFFSFSSEHSIHTNQSFLNMSFEHCFRIRRFEELSTPPTLYRSFKLFLLRLIGITGKWSGVCENIGFWVRQWWLKERFFGEKRDKWLVKKIRWKNKCRMKDFFFREWKRFFCLVEALDRKWVLHWRRLVSQFRNLVNHKH